MYWNVPPACARNQASDSPASIRVSDDSFRRLLLSDPHGGSASNYPNRGGKGSAWEGGMRVSAFVAGGLLPAKMHGRVFGSTSQIIHVADCKPQRLLCASASLPPRLYSFDSFARASAVLSCPDLPKRSARVSRVCHVLPLGGR